MRKIYLYGASITYGVYDPVGGWAGRLRRHVENLNLESMEERYYVFNLGIPGDTTEFVLERCEAEYLARTDDEEAEELYSSLLWESMIPVLIVNRIRIELKLMSSDLI